MRKGLMEDEVEQRGAELCTAVCVITSASMVAVCSIGLAESEVKELLIEVFRYTRA